MDRTIERKRLRIISGNQMFIVSILYGAHVNQIIFKHKLHWPQKFLSTLHFCNVYYFVYFKIKMNVWFYSVQVINQYHCSIS